MILDQLKPYLAIIRIAGYALLIGFLFVSGCNYGKRGEQAKVVQLEAERDACLSANQANQSAIDALTEANKAYALESQKQAEAVAKAQKELKQAEKRAQAREKALNKELQDAYAKNKQWGDTAVPADYIRLLNRTR